MKSMKKILVLALGGLFALPAAANKGTSLPNNAGIAMMRLQTTTFSSSSDHLRSGDIWAHLRSDFRMDEVNANLVRSHEIKFSSNQAYFNRTLNRSTPYMYHIMNEVQKRGMPTEIALLPFIESAFVTKARSHVGASGLWQFMPATGRHYGLEQTPFYDGRHDIYAATNAALNYLEYLYGLFGDWSLALAAYNWGEGNVSRAIRKAQEKGLPPTYENLNMPAETRNYVPKLLAVRNLVNNPQAFGLKLPDVANKPYFKEVEIKEPIDIMAAAFLADIPESEFLALNPAFKTPVFIPKNNNRRMLLPIQAANKFEQNYRNADSKTLLSWDVFTPSSAMDLNTLAAKTGSSVNELKRLNGIKGNSVAAGRTILFSKNAAATLNNTQQLAQLDTDNTPDTFVEQAPVLTVKQMTQFKAVAQVEVNAPSNKLPENPALAQAAPATPQPAFASLANVVAPKALADNSLTVQPESIQVAKTESAQTTEPEDDLLALISSTQVERNNVKAAADTLAIKETPTVRATVAAVKTATTNAVPAKEKNSRQNEVASNKKSDNRASNSIKNNVKTTNYKVDAGETLFAIAQKNDMTVADLMALNQLKNEQIQRGQTLKVVLNKNNSKDTRTAKASKTKAVNHKVASGDTLYSIAKQYELDVDDLAAANGLKGSHLKAGQILKVSLSGADKKAKDSKANANKKEKMPAVYHVKKGDTLESIANRYKLDVSDLKRLNKGGSSIKAGQKLKLS